MTPAFNPMVRRFAGPVLAAWLIFIGLWMILDEAEQVVLSLLTKTLNWMGDHIITSSPRIEEASVSARYLLLWIAEALVPIIFGLLVGWWILRMRRKTPAPAPRAAAQ